MNRRTFAKSSAAWVFGLAVMSSTFLTGCSAVTDLENWIPVALSAVAAIVNLLGPIVPPNVAGIIVLITDGFQALLTALKKYQAGTGVLQDISNAFTAIVSAFQNFFSELNVPSGLLSTIEGLAQILLSTLLAFENQIIPKTSISGQSFRIGAHAINVMPIKRNIAKFKSDWNMEAAKDKQLGAQI